MSMSHARTLAAITLSALMLGAIVGTAGGAGSSRAASGTAPGDGHQASWRSAIGEVAGHARAAVAGTIEGVAAARDARRAYRGDPAYAAPFPAPYYPYPNGYPYW